MLLPVLSLMLVPIAVVRAQPAPTIVEVDVICYSGYYLPASITVTYHTQKVHVACQGDDYGIENGMCVSTTTSSAYKVTTAVNGVVETFTGHFGPNSGELSGSQGSPLGGEGDTLSYAGWCIYVNSEC